MKNLIFYFLMVILLPGCWICPDPVYIEFDNSIKAITVLSENYYISEVTIAEYVQENGSVSLSDSGIVNIAQTGPRGATILSIKEPASNYIVTGKNPVELLKKDHLHFTVLLKRFGKTDKNNTREEEEITFVKEVIKSERQQFNSKHPCP